MASVISAFVKTATKLGTTTADIAKFTKTAGLNVGSSAYKNLTNTSLRATKQLDEAAPLLKTNSVVVKNTQAIMNMTVMTSLMKRTLLSFKGIMDDIANTIPRLATSAKSITSEIGVITKPALKSTKANAAIVGKRLSTIAKSAKSSKTVRTVGMAAAGITTVGIIALGRNVSLINNAKFDLLLVEPVIISSLKREVQDYLLDDYDDLTPESLLYVIIHKAIPQNSTNKLQLGPGDTIDVRYLDNIFISDPLGAKILLTRSINPSSDPDTVVGQNGVRIYAKLDSAEPTSEMYVRYNDLALKETTDDGEKIYIDNLIDSDNGCADETLCSPGYIVSHTTFLNQISQLGDPDHITTAIENNGGSISGKLSDLMGSATNYFISIMYWVAFVMAVLIFFYLLSWIVYFKRNWYPNNPNSNSNNTNTNSSSFGRLRKPSGRGKMYNV